MTSSKAASGVQGPTRSEKSALGLRPPVAAARFIQDYLVEALGALRGLAAEYRVDFAWHAPDSVLDLARLSLDTYMIAGRAGTYRPDGYSARAH